jgi:predicted DNA-binding transcriptional regulator AlpA
MMTLSNSRVVRPGELAERLGVSRVTLWRWERKGLLPPKHRVGPNVVGWLVSEIDEWFARTTGDSAEHAASLEPEKAERTACPVPAAGRRACR